VILGRSLAQESCFQEDADEKSKREVEGVEIYRNFPKNCHMIFLKKGSLAKMASKILSLKGLEMPTV